LSQGGGFDRTARQKRLAGGISTASERVTAGTLTGRFVDKTDNMLVLVSNRHVFEGEAGKTAILQPGPYDGGRKPDDVVGVLKRSVELEQRERFPWWRRILCILFGWLLEEWCTPEIVPSKLDAACATLWAPGRIIEGGVYLDDGTIIKPRGTHTGDGIAGRKVWKSGRTTGVTVGVVESDSAKVKVWYGDKWIIFEDVILVRGMARGGDSGSPVFLMEGEGPGEKDRICGILFAGSSEVFVACKYKYLEELLGVSWEP